MAATSSLAQTTFQCSSLVNEISNAIVKNPHSVSFKTHSNGQMKLTSSIFGNAFVAKAKCNFVRSTPKICLAAYAEDEEETEEEITAAYEALYGKAFANLNKNQLNTGGDDDEDEDSSRGRRGRRGDGEFDQKDRRAPKDAFEEQVIQVRRVTKVVKGGKQLSFRAVVVLGDRKGTVGVGVGKAKEVVVAVQKSAADARRHLVTVPMTKYLTFPHRADGTSGAAKVMLRPAAPGTGVIAGGAVRVVLELAGVENALGKELGSGNPLNNARAVLDAANSMKQFRDVAKARNIPMEELWK